MFKTLIFGGTSEGRELAEFCAENGIAADISVTTDYGAELLPLSKSITVSVGRLDIGQMKELIYRGGYCCVIDATHPYAVLATENIRAACGETEAEYYRLVREDSDCASGLLAETPDELVRLLNRGGKRILSTLGSKELPALTKVSDFKRRLWVRVLPAEGIGEYCEALGIDRRHIILGKGPFSFEENIRHIKLCGAEILVTKDSGAAGGYPEKIAAAKECSVELITLKRPRENGYFLREIEEILLEKRWID